MTSHRLARCDVDEVIDSVNRRHPHSRTDVDLGGASALTTPAWRTGCKRPPRLVWRQRIAGGARIDCRLVIDQGANGLLVHLSAEPATPARIVPGRVARLAVEMWCSSELAALVRDAEASHALVGVR